MVEAGQCSSVAITGRLTFSNLGTTMLEGLEMWQEKSLCHNV